MKYAVIFLLISIIAISVTAFIYYKLYKKYKVIADTEQEKYEGLEKEFAKLVEANKIKSKNKEEADEKINNLHNGDSVDNAINILRK